MNPISRNALLILFDTISGRLTTGIWLSLYLAVVTVAFSGGEAWAALSPYLVQGLTLTYQGYQCNNQHSPDSPTACSNPASNAPPATPISLTFAVNNVNGNTVSVSYNGTPAQCIIASNTSACSNFPQFWVNPANPVYVNGIYGTGALQTPLTVQSSCSPNQICMSATVPLASNTTTTISARFDAVTGLLLSYTETFVNIGTGTFNGDNTEFVTFQIAPPYPLTVIETGNGSVSSAPGGISCGATCSAGFPAGTPVTLTPAGPAGMSFAGWGGACSGTGACTVTMNSLAGVSATFGPSQTFCCKDLNGGGQADIVWRDNTGEVYAWLMNGLSITNQGPVENVGNDWQIAGIGDFNGDGKADILWRNVSGEVYAWLMNGLSIASQGSLGVIGNDWQIARVGDFNGDGKADILWRDTSTGEVYIWLMNGLSIASQGSLGVIGSDWQIAGVGDFNGDGKADILWRDASGEVYIWLMSGLSIASQGSLGVIGIDWQIAGVGDFNADGKADILWRDASGEVYIWLMNGLSIASQGSQGVIGSDWQIAGAGDFNGDGKADILWRDTSGEVYTWLMNGLSILNQGSLGVIGNDWSIE
jgi:hypothetical protein